jgi:hypothetical protein
MKTKAISKNYFSSHRLLLAAGLGFILTAGLINHQTEKPMIEVSKQETAINVDQKLVLLMSAGHKRIFTDLLWIQTLIESDLEHYNKRDLGNWLFLRFNTMAALDPQFYQNYLYGGLFLGIVKDDLEGADVIYGKGLVVFPDDFSLNYNAGFLRYFELGKMEKALVSLQKIRNNPKAPVFIHSIINKLLLATGTGLEEIFGLVLFNYNSSTDSTLKKRLKKDLYAIRSQIDLECLNNKGVSCAHRDLEGTPYQNQNGVWHSPKPFLPYRITRRSKEPQKLKEVDTIK